MDIIIETKSINGQYKSAKENASGEKIYTFIASTSDKDRHNEKINQAGWELDNFMDNPIIGYQHNVWGSMCGGDDPDDVVGKAVKAYVENDQLMVDVVFDEENEKAMKIASKIDRGYLKTVSVGFKGIEGHWGVYDDDEDPDVYYHDKQELVELSIVNIPANPKAKRKEFRSNTFDAIKYLYKEFGGNLKFAEIEEMKVGDVIKMLEGKEEKATEDKGAPKELDKTIDEKSEKVEEVETTKTEETEGNTLEATQEEVEETESTNVNSVDAIGLINMI